MPSTGTAALRVATYNLYLGADLSLVLGEGGDAGLDEVLRQLGATTFSERAESIARILTREQLDVVALQEVCLWRLDEEVMSDFLADLLAALDRIGDPFEPVTSVATFAGSVSLEVEGVARRVGVVGSNVILRRAGSDVSVREAGAGLFSNALETVAPGGATLSITRGWCAAWCAVGDREVLVVDTHTEAYDAASRDAQRDELLSAVEALGGSAPVVLLGDFNATPDTVGMPSAYVDAWVAGGPPDDTAPGDAVPGATCGQQPDLSNSDGALAMRIDYVFVRGLRVIAARRAGHRPEERTPGGLWPSDHVAVVAELDF